MRPHTEPPKVLMRSRAAVWLGMALSLAFAVSLFALANQEFEAATVRRAADGPRKGGITGGPGTSDPGRIAIRAYPLQLLIRKAYGLADHEYRGPEWAATEKYDIVATLPPGSDAAALNVMLQHLLEERLQLKYHREGEQITTFDLTVSKGGTKLAPTADDRPGQPGVRPALGPRGADGFPRMDPEYVRSVGASTLIIRETAKTVAVHESMDSFAGHLSVKLGHPVRNRTGLTGTYDFAFLWSALDAAREPGESPATSGPEVAAGPSIFTALEKSLGLRLEKTKSYVSVFVVDHIERNAPAN